MQQPACVALGLCGSGLAQQLACRVAGSCGGWLEERKERCTTQTVQTVQWG